MSSPVFTSWSLSAALLFATALLASTPAFAEVTPSENPKIIVAVIAAAGVVIGALVSATIAFWTARTTAKNTLASDYSKRQIELALKISELVSDPDPDRRKAAMRRFSVAVVKTVEPKDHGEWGRVHFVPMNSRITIGRKDDNDIVLDDDKGTLSRHHCGLLSDQRNVWIDDYSSLNGTKVNGQPIKGSTLLKDGDRIEIPPFKIEFRMVKENSILTGPIARYE
jgi:hypothetical protein